MGHHVLGLALSLVAFVDAASNPLTYTPFWIETSQGFVTLVQLSGKLQDKVLTPGLHFTPWRLLGEKYTNMPTSPQTSCYRDVFARTKDMAMYKIGVCVVNQVSSEDMVDVVRAFGFEYNHKNKLENLEIHHEIAIKEVVAGYDMVELQVTKANQFNDDVKNKLKEELDVTYGPVGRKISILGVTISNKEVTTEGLQKEFEKQTSIQNQIRTEEETRKKQAMLEDTETKKTRDVLNNQFELLKKSLLNEETEVKGKNEVQEAANKQALENAKNEAAVARTEALSKHEETRMRAELYENYKAYAQHERAMGYSAVLANQTKFVIQDSVNAGTQNSMLNANVMSYIMNAGEQ